MTVLTPDENRTLTVLRNEAEAARNGTMVVDGPDIEMAELLDDAADEIERLREENERLRADTEQERLLGFKGGVCSVHDQALHEGRDDIATWIANRYPTATKSTSALPTDHNAPGQADANPSQCPTSKTE